jgi:hypothetical protein
MIVFWFVLIMVSMAWSNRMMIDPDRVARSETRMWKACYTEDAMTVGMEIVEMLSSHFDLSRPDAMEVAQPLLRATMTFKGVKSNYENLVLPDLAEAYMRLRRASGIKFSPNDAARAELDWWVAGRTPGIDSPEEVGQRIARLYTLLFGENKQEFEKAGLLRARAAYVRDTGGMNCDWDKVEKLLKKSYRELQKGL